MHISWVDAVYVQSCCCSVFVWNKTQQRSGILVKQHVRVYCFIVMKRLGPENIFCKVVNLRANQVILRNGPLF